MSRKEKRELKSKQEWAADALMKAIRAQDLTAVHAFLAGEQRQYADLDDRHVYLHTAVTDGTPEILEALLKAGANPRIGWDKASGVYADEIFTPLRMAIQNDKIEMARVLLQDPRTEDPAFQAYFHQTASGHGQFALSARNLAKYYNRAAEWDELFDLVEARRFMEKFNKAKAVLEKAGELPKPEAAPPKTRPALKP